MEWQLALWQQISLGGLALIAFFYVAYFRIWLALAAGADLIFVFALAMSITSIAVPRAFDVGARWTVEQSPLPAALVEADQRVVDLETLPSRLIKTALAKVGLDRDEPDTATTALIEPVPGPFESRIRPAVESLIAVVLRGATFFASCFLLLMALALRASTATARAIGDLEARLAARAQSARSENAPSA